MSKKLALEVVYSEDLPVWGEAIPPYSPEHEFSKALVYRRLFRFLKWLKIKGSWQVVITGMYSRLNSFRYGTLEKEPRKGTGHGGVFRICTFRSDALIFDVSSSLSEDDHRIAWLKIYQGMTILNARREAREKHPHMKKLQDFAKLQNRVESLKARKTRNHRACKAARLALNATIEELRNAEIELKQLRASI